MDTRFLKFWPNISPFCTLILNYLKNITPKQLNCLKNITVHLSVGEVVVNVTKRGRLCAI